MDSRDLSVIYPSASLLDSLNELLGRLSIDIELESPLDLTPSLLLAILESILCERLPLPPELRQPGSHRERVQAVKIFLGVLGDDVLRMDLGEVDPRRLADGEPEEIKFVAGLLCVLGKQRGVFDDEWDAKQDDVPMHSDLTTTKRTDNASTSSDRSRIPPPRATSTPPPPPLKHSKTRPLSISPNSSFNQTFGIGSPVSTSTSMTSDFPLHDQNASGMLHSHIEAEEKTCQCSMSHGIEDTFLTTTTCCRCSTLPGSPPPSPPSRPASSRATPVRYHGWINRIDDVSGLEPASFRSSTRSLPTKTPTRSVPNPTRHISPSQHTLALLNERARLLEELASLKSNSSPGRR